MDIILLVFACVYLAGRGRIAASRASQYPHVPVKEFQRWRRLELRSRDIIICAGFGWMAVEVLAYLVMQRFPLMVVGAGFPILLLVLVISAVLGSQATKIKKKHNIQLDPLTAYQKALSTPPPRFNQRTWTDASGTFQTDAELVGMEDGNVRLKKADGSVITVPIDRLSDNDRHFVQQSCT